MRLCCVALGRVMISVMNPDWIEELVILKLSFTKYTIYIEEIIELHAHLTVHFFWGGGVVCFPYPTSPPRSPIGWFPCVPSNTLSSPRFKGVTRGMSFKHTSPPPCYPWLFEEYICHFSFILLSLYSSTHLIKLKKLS